MFTVTILNQKGGSGKSTLAECLAVSAYLDGQASAILDMDPQGTAYEWFKRRRATERELATQRGEDPADIAVNPPVIAVALSNMKDEWARLKAAGADFVIIDTPARLNDWALMAAELSDLVIVPSKPTIKDLERVEASIKLASLTALRPTFVVLNQTRPKGDRTDQAREIITSRKYPVCPTSFGYRVAFEDADTIGRTPEETEPGGLAALEITEVYAFTMKLLQQVKTKDGSDAEQQEKELSRRAS